MMVTGELPFRCTGPLDAWMKKVQNELPAPRQLVPTLSERVDWAIMRAMSPDREARPASCREFVEDLTGQSTRRPAASATAAPKQEWFLMYTDDDGESHRVKGGLNTIRKSLREGLLGDASNVRASRIKGGPYEALRDFPEFRDLVVSPMPLSPSGNPFEPQPSTEVTVPPIARPVRDSAENGRTKAPALRAAERTVKKDISATKGRNSFWILILLFGLPIFVLLIIILVVWLWS